MKEERRNRKCSAVVAGLILACILASLYSRRLMAMMAFSSEATSKVIHSTKSRNHPVTYWDELGQRTNPSDFVHPLDEFPTTRKDLPLPIQSLEEYISYHSVESLTKNPDLERRKYAIGMLSCNDRAGNRIHEFINSFHWAILTNRTFLWQYRTPHDSTCSEQQRNETRSLCSNDSEGTAEVCERILARAPWVPMYDEWKEMLDLPEPIELTTFEGGEEAFHEMGRHERWHSKRLKGEIDRRRKAKVVYFPDIQQQFTYFGERRFRNKMLAGRGAKHRAIALQSLGANFMFGMLERYTFDLSASLKATTDAGGSTSLSNGEDKSWTLGLHSRHTHKGSDGCDVERELACIDQVVAELGETRPVSISLMADRQCTLEQLQLRLGKRNIATKISDHHSLSVAKGEHGPFAGLGYYQDLALVSRARSGFVGVCRSSTQLVMERLEFYRKMEFWAAGGNMSAIPDIPTCSITSLKNTSMQGTDLGCKKETW